jgi:hypothetical protein
MRRVAVQKARGTRLLGAIGGAVVIFLVALATRHTLIGAVAMWPFRSLAELLVLQLQVSEGTGTTLAVVVGLCTWSLVLYCVASFSASLAERWRREA